MQKLTNVGLLLSGHDEDSNIEHLVPVPGEALIPMAVALVHAAPAETHKLIAHTGGRARIYGIDVREILPEIELGAVEISERIAINAEKASLWDRILCLLDSYRRDEEDVIDCFKRRMQDATRADLIEKELLAVVGRTAELEGGAVDVTRALVKSYIESHDATVAKIVHDAEPAARLGIGDAKEAQS